MKTMFFRLKLSGMVLAIAVLASWGFFARADALDNWMPSLVATNPIGYYGLRLGGVTYGNSRYVAVGQYVGDDNGVIQTSENGVDWTMRTRQDYSVLDLADVTYGNGIFVAVGWDWFGGQNIYSSTDGIQWTPHTTGIANLYRVIFGGGLFVAVGDGLLLQSSTTTNENIYISADGTDWYAVKSGAPANDVHSLYDIAYGAGRFVAVDGAGYFYSSTDGVSWSRSFNGRAGGWISFCNNLFIVPAGQGTNLVSNDGATWSLLPNSTTNTFARVIYADGVFVGLTGSGFFSSVDGTNWVQRDFQLPSNTTLTAMVFGSRNIVVAGYNTSSSPNIPVVYTSDPFVACGINSGFPPQLTLSGLAGRSYRVEYLSNLVSNNWQTLTTLSLTNSPSNWTDTQATNSSRFYRAVLLP